MTLYCAAAPSERCESIDIMGSIMARPAWKRRAATLFCLLFTSCAGTQFPAWDEVERLGVIELLTHYHDEAVIAEGQFVSFEHLPRMNSALSGIDGFHDHLITSFPESFRVAIESLIANMRIQELQVQESVVEVEQEFIFPPGKSIILRLGPWGSDTVTGNKVLYFEAWGRDWEETGLILARKNADGSRQFVFLPLSIT